MERSVKNAGTRSNSLTDGDACGDAVPFIPIRKDFRGLGSTSEEPLRTLRLVAGLRVSLHLLHPVASRAQAHQRAGGGCAGVERLEVNSGGQSSNHSNVIAGASNCTNQNPTTSWHNRMIHSVG